MYVYCITLTVNIYDVSSSRRGENRAKKAVLINTSHQNMCIQLLGNKGYKVNSVDANSTQSKVWLYLSYLQTGVYTRTMYY